MAFVSPSLFGTLAAPNSAPVSLHYENRISSRLCISRNPSIQISCCAARKPPPPPRGRGRSKRRTIKSETDQDSGQSKNINSAERDNEKQIETKRASLSDLKEQDDSNLIHEESIVEDPRSNDTSVPIRSEYSRLITDPELPDGHVPSDAEKMIPKPGLTNDANETPSLERKEDDGAPVVRRRGRPKGSKNRPKTISATPNLSTQESKPGNDITKGEEGIESAVIGRKRKPGRPKVSKNKSSLSGTISSPSSGSSVPVVAESKTGNLPTFVGPRNGSNSPMKPRIATEDNPIWKKVDERPVAYQTPKKNRFQTAKSDVREPSAGNKMFPKRKRGRPVGSTNKPKASDYPLSDISDWEWASFIAEGETDMDLDLLEDLIKKWRTQSFQKPARKDWRKADLKAPNGLPGSGPDDYFYELIPLFSKLEAKRNREVSEHEKEIRQLLASAFQRFASTHRSSGRLANLKPFKLREEEKKVCSACKGTGMVKCEYCDGEGFVDFGENAHKFHEEFEEGTMLLPKHVMGNIYHCPYCGGLTRERCVPCLGSGSIEDAEPRKRGASRTPMNNFAWDQFDIDELIEQEKDRIEVGLDGTIIMRARKRRSKKKKGDAEQEAKETDMLERKAKRQPKKLSSRTSSPNREGGGLNSYTEIDSDVSRANVPSRRKDIMRTPENISSPTFPSLRPIGRTTDFVNTTNFRVGRALSRQERIPFSEQTSIRNDSTSDSQRSIDEEPPTTDETPLENQNESPDQRDYLEDI